MEFTGILRVIKEEKQITPRFSKREFVVETSENPSYPQLICFELINEKAALLDSFKLGDTLNIWFDLRGREWQSGSGEVRHFNTLSAWRVEVDREAPRGNDKEDRSEVSESADFEEDDLPF